MRRLLLLVATMSVTVACSLGDGDKGFGESREVDAQDYGATWPLTVETALLNCSPEGDLFLQADGHAFSLGPMTVEDAEPALRRVWAENPDKSEERMDLAPLIEDARELCE